MSKNKISKFYKNPCFLCENLTADSDGDDYSDYSWWECKKEQDDEVLEIFTRSSKKNYPFCEAPNRCLRRGDFKIDFKKIGDKPQKCSFWSKVDDMAFQLQEELVGDENFPTKWIYDAVHSILDFDARMLSIKISRTSHE